MSFGNPFAFFFFLLLPVIIAMYLLKLRRKEQLVSSVFLWRKMVRDVEANAPWQKLRRNLLLILQLLLLIAMIVALAKPFTTTNGLTGEDAILVIDTSASMAASDVPPNRLEAAKVQALQMVEDMPDGARFTIISAGGESELLIADSTDRQKVNAIIDGLQAGNGGSDMDAALQLASAKASQKPDVKVMVITDGGVSLPERLTIQGDFRYSLIGSQDDNQAIGLINLNPSDGGENIAAFVQVINYGEGAATRRLGIYADDQLYNIYDLSIPSRGTQSILVEGLQASTQLVEARLLSSEGSRDYLASDDRAFAVHRREEPVKVVLVTQGNVFLQTALSLMPGLETAVVEPDEGEQLPDADLIIYDGFVPITTTLAQEDLLIIAPPSNTEIFSVSGVVQSPVPILSDLDSPIIDHVSLEGINILDAIRIQLPEWAKPIISTNEPGAEGGKQIPLLFAGETGGRRVAVIAFDLHHTDLPLQVAFPILFTNLVHWLSPGAGGGVPSQLLAGEALVFTPSVSDISATAASTVRFQRPDGNVSQIQVASGQVVYEDTNQLGVYQLDTGTRTPILFAVNLFSPQESNISPRDSLPLSGISLSNDPGAAPPAQRDWWRIGALIALVLLIVEWMVYQRPAMALMINKLGSRRTMMDQSR
jgi:hypothetical protein